jgi:integrase
MTAASNGGRERPPARFTDQFISKLKVPPGAANVTVFEARTGLGIRKSAAGAVSFVCQLRLRDGRRWRQTVGSYGKLTIAAAREAVQVMAGDIAKNIDPFAEAEKAREAAKEAAAAKEAERFTLRVLVKRWERDHLSGRRYQYAKRAVANVTRAFADLMDTPAAKITRREVRAAIDLAREKSGPGTARQAGVQIGSAFRWAVGEDLLETNPLQGIKLPDAPPARERTPSEDEARRLWAAAGALNYPAGPFVRLLMLTGCRRNEIARLRWDEIADEADGSKAIVLVGERTKTGVGHHVPLSRAALDVLAECRRMQVIGCQFVLSSDGWRATNDFDRIKNALMDKVAEAGRPIENLRLHDFRRCLVSTLARKPYRFDPVVLDKLLGHQPSKLSPVARIYSREEFHDVRREALEAWGEYLTRPAAEVVTLQNSAK